VFDRRKAERGLFPDQDKDARDKREDWEQDAGAHSGKTNDANHDQVYREQEQSNVFGKVHGGMVSSANP
jgi:hypothetical protein